MKQFEVARKGIIFPMSLVLINALVFVFNVQIGTDPVWDYLSLKVNEPLLPRLWTIITAQFIHGSPNHITGNMAVFAPTAVYLTYKRFNWSNLYWVIPSIGLFAYVTSTSGWHGGFSGVVFFTVGLAIVELMTTKMMRLGDLMFSLYAFANSSMLIVLMTPLDGVSYQSHLAGFVMALLYTFAKTYTVKFHLSLNKKS